MFCSSYYTFEHCPSTAHHHKPTEHHTSTSHKNHLSDNKSSTVEPGALKDIILQGKPLQQNKSQISALSTPTLHNSVGSTASEPAKTAKQGQVTGNATGRAILVHSSDDEVGHVVQGKTIN